MARVVARLRPGGWNNADSFAVYVLTFVKSFLLVSDRFPLRANERFTNEIRAVN